MRTGKQVLFFPPHHRLRRSFSPGRSLWEMPSGARREDCKGRRRAGTTTLPSDAYASSTSPCTGEERGKRGRGDSLMSSRTRNAVKWRDLPASGKGRGMKAFPLGVSRALCAPPRCACARGFPLRAKTVTSRREGKPSLVEGLCRSGARARSAR